MFTLLVNCAHLSMAMVQPREIKIKYGAYEACGIVHYRTFRLEGLKSNCVWRCLFQQNCLN